MQSQQGAGLNYSGMEMKVACSRVGQVEVGT